MNITHQCLIASLLGALCLNSVATAEKAPLSDDALRTEAQAIVVGTVESIRIEAEEATLGRGLGNSDWGIYLTLQVESVEKGKVDRGTLEARCFRIKSRRSIQEYLAPSGHHPIPEVGTRVRACLTKRAGSWDVVLPNGIAAEGNADSARDVLADAQEVAQLRSLAYTYILPLEGWLLVLLIGAPVTMCVGWLRRHKKRSLGN